MEKRLGGAGPTSVRGAEGKKGSGASEAARRVAERHAVRVGALACCEKLVVEVLSVGGKPAELLTIPPQGIGSDEVALW